jgi:hypothetical protein
MHGMGSHMYLLLSPEMSLILIVAGVTFSAIQRNVRSLRTEGKENGAARHGTVHMIKDQQVQYLATLRAQNIPPARTEHSLTVAT